MTLHYWERRRLPTYMRCVHSSAVGTQVLKTRPEQHRFYLWLIEVCTTTDRDSTSNATRGGEGVWIICSILLIRFVIIELILKALATVSRNHAIGSGWWRARSPSCCVGEVWNHFRFNDYCLLGCWANRSNAYSIPVIWNSYSIEVLVCSVQAMVLEIDQCTFHEYIQQNGSRREQIIH